MRLTLLLLAAATALLSACATLPNTPQQDYVWAMWDLCKGTDELRSSSTSIDRVDPDGRYWSNTTAGPLEAEWPRILACMNLQSKAHPYREWLKARHAESGPPTAPRATAPLESDPGAAYRTMSDTINALSRDGRIDEAIAAAKNQLDLVQRVGQIPIGNGTYWSPSSVLVKLSWLYYRYGRFVESLRYAEDAYARRTLDRPIPSFLADILARRGLARFELFDAAGALPDFTEALRLTEGSPNVRFVANQYHNIGLAHFSLGNYQRAIASIEQALALDRRSPSSPELPSHLATLARVYGHLNEFATAHQYLDEALQLSKRMYYPSLVQNTLRRMSELYRWQGDYLSALRSANEALALAQSRGQLAAQGWLHWEIGYTQLSQGNYADAQESFRLAQQVADHIPNPTLAAFATFGTAEAFRKAGNYAAADLSFRALEPTLGRLGTTSYTWKVWYAKGQLREAEGRLADALDAYAEAIRQIEELRIRLPTVERRAVFVEDKQDAYEAMIRVLFRLRRVPLAFEYTQRAKGRAFLDLLAQRQVRRRLADHQRNPLAEEAASVSDDIAHRQAELSHPTGAPAASADELRRGVQELRAAEARWKDLQAKMAQSGRSYEGDVSWTPVTTKALQEALPENTALVSYYLGKEAGWLFYIDRHGVVGHQLTHPRNVIEQDVLALRHATMPIMKNDQATFGDWRTPAIRLHDELIAPILHRLKAKSHLIVGPHRALHYLPFGMLMAADGSPLIERVALSRVPSVSTLTLLTHRARRTRRGLGVANPTIPDLSRLPGAEQEVLALNRNWPSDILVEEAATKAAVLQRLHLSPVVVDFATHAELDRIAPLESSVRLTPMGDDDGRLTVNDIFDLDMTTELVVLAACDTAIGIGYKGRDGAKPQDLETSFPPGDELVGLSRAFLQAGVPSLVATLWPVEDTSTAQLMTHFYENLKTMPRAEALRQAQLTVRADRLHPRRGPEDGSQEAAGPNANHTQTRQPYFWAGVILIGDGDASMPRQ